MKQILFLAHFFIIGVLLTPFSIASPNEEISENQSQASQLIYALPDEIWRQHIVPYVKGKDSKALREVSHYFAESDVLSFKIDDPYIFQTLVDYGTLTCRAAKFYMPAFDIDQVLTLLPNIVSLTISGMYYTSPVIELVNKLRKASTLYELNLKLDTVITEDDIRALAGLTQLRILEIGGSTNKDHVILSPTAINSLSLLSNTLQALSFDFNVSDSTPCDLSSISKLSRLKVLHFLFPIYFHHFNQIGPVEVIGLNTLKDCPQLEELCLSGVLLDIDTIRSISHFPKKLKKVILGPEYSKSITEKEVELLQTENPTIEFVLIQSKQIASPVSLNNASFDLNELL